MTITSTIDPSLSAAFHSALYSLFNTLASQHKDAGQVSFDAIKSQIQNESLDDTALLAALKASRTATMESKSTNNDEVFYPLFKIVSVNTEQRTFSFGLNPELLKRYYDEIDSKSNSLAFIN